MAASASNNQNPGSEAEVGPLGQGRAPVKDPLKGLRGVVAGTLVMEAIVLGLALLVILKVDSGSMWTTPNITFVSGLAIAHLVLAFFQRFNWGLPASLALQVVGLGGFFIHWSIGAVVVIFILVWWYVLSLRKNLIERMKRGLLVTQHLDAKS